MTPQRRLPPLQWLRSFEASARHLSFTGAAQELNVTQSAISQQIKALEQYLGQALFLRRSRSLALSEAGRNFLPTVQEAFALLTDGTRAFWGYEPQKVIEIKANTAFSAFWLAPRIGDFLCRHPGLEIRLSTALWESDFSGGNASVEIRFGRGQWTGVRAEKLATVTAFPVCAPGLAKHLKGPGDLAAVPRIHITPLRDDWDSWLTAAGVPGLTAPAHHHFNTFVLTLDLAKRGLGVALAHNIIAEELLAGGDLVRLFDTAIETSESYYLIAPRQEDLAAGAAAFCQWLRTTMA